MTDRKIVLVTGTSSGFGRAASLTLARAGYVVYASMRGVNGKNAVKAEALAREANNDALEIVPIEVDVTIASTCEAAADRIVSDRGRIDAVVNNAGMLCMGVTEAFTPDQVARVFDTNVLGPLRMNQAVLPHMRAAGGGHLVYVGSVTSDIVSPFQGPYIASKAAEDRMAETMHYELSSLGIDTTIIQPGAFTSGTEHFPHAMKPGRGDVVGAYDAIADLPGKLAERLDRLVRDGVRVDAQDVADAVLRAIELPSGERPFRMVVDPQEHGADAVGAVRAVMQRRLMDRLGIGGLMRIAPNPYPGKAELRTDGPWIADLDTGRVEGKG